MEIAEAADLLRRGGNLLEARRLYSDASHLASEAATALSRRLDFEPTRSIFFRSAASLALEAGQNRECERLVCEALLGSPPADIAADLRDIWTQSTFEDHLQIRDLKIGEPEVVISIFGGNSGSTLFRFDQVLHKLEYTQVIAVRTAERMAGLRYRESGQPTLVNRILPIYTAPALSRSFAIVLRFGELTKQLTLFPDLNPTAVAEEMFTCLKAVAERELSTLRPRFKETAYYRNFAGVARLLAPANKTEPFIGVMTAADGVVKRAVLARSARESIDSSAPLFTSPRNPAPIREFTGKLLRADAVARSSSTIVLVDQAGDKHEVGVPKGMMKDVVTKHFDEEVVLKAAQLRGRYVLRSIDSIE